MKHSRFWNAHYCGCHNYYIITRQVKVESKAKEGRELFQRTPVLLVLYLLTRAFVIIRLPLQTVLCSLAEHSVKQETATPSLWTLLYVLPVLDCIGASLLPAIGS